MVVLFPPAGPLGGSVEAAAPGHGGEAGQPHDGEVATPPGWVGLEVKLLGPIAVQPLGPTKRRHGVMETCCYLSLNGDREVASDELRHILGTSDKDLAPATLYNVVSDLRKAVGSDVLVTFGHAGYRFSGKVTCDWVSFKELVGKHWQDEEERIAHLTDAVALVRAPPFASPAKDRYQWAHDRGYVEEMVTAIDNAAVELCKRLLRAERDAEAYDAAQLGLRAARQSYTLHACRLEAARGDRGRIVKAWKDTHDTVGDVAELRALKDRLLGESG
jgi:hypothetical protein